MKSYKELDERVKKFSISLYKTIIGPRIDIETGGSVSIVVEDVRIPSVVFIATTAVLNLSDRIPFLCDQGTLIGLSSRC